MADEEIEIICNTPLNEFQTSRSYKDSNNTIKAINVL